MIRAKDLKKLINTLPDDAKVIAYQGEACGLRILSEGRFGWIETGYDDNKECNHSDHDIEAIKKREGQE